MKPVSSYPTSTRGKRDLVNGPTLPAQSCMFDELAVLRMGRGLLPQRLEELRAVIDALQGRALTVHELADLAPKLGCDPLPPSHLFDVRRAERIRALVRGGRPSVAA